MRSVKVMKKSANKSDETKKTTRNRNVFGPEYDFGRYLKLARVSKGISQKKMADLLNTFQSNLSEYEADKQKPSIMLIMDFAKHCGTDVNTLVGFDAPKKTKINGIFNKLSSVNKEKLIEYAELLFSSQTDNELNLVNYNTKQKKG